jgi:hypothetical protein
MNPLEFIEDILDWLMYWRFNLCLVGGIALGVIGMMWTPDGVLQWVVLGFWVVPVAAAIVEPAYLPLGLGMSAITGMFALLLVLAWRKDRPKGLLVLPAAFMLALVLYGVHALIPRMESLKSPRPFCDKIVAYCDEGADWAMFRFYRATYVYYTDSFAEVLETERDLAHFMARTNHAVVIMKEKHFNALENPDLKALPIIERANVGSKELVLLANRETP